ncbi:MAG: HIRAN domain-containing protein [Acidimicrobiales bacterium]
MAVSAHLFGGDEDLEIVGEASYQDALWTICRGSLGDQVRHRVVAVVVPEPDNPYDPNAIAVHVEGDRVGYLAREDAARYGPGLHGLMERCGGYVALSGVIVGGGYYDDGPGRLGVWLDHDPADFGLRPSRRTGPAGRPAADRGAMRTGFSEAWMTDLDDDSYDLCWFDELPDADMPAIAMLRSLLATDPDPIDRHFQFAELESRLYRCRDLYDTALNEYDAACQAHDSEMEVICQAFMAKWGKVPLLETYRQMAIRQQKEKDWRTCLWWAERGLALYGNNAARLEAVEDLLKRRNRALAKLDTSMTTSATSQQRTDATVRSALADGSSPSPQPIAAGVSGEIEVLVCSRCGGSFERIKVRGRKPLLCPDCRTTATPA